QSASGREEHRDHAHHQRLLSAASGRVEHRRSRRRAGRALPDQLADPAAGPRRRAPAGDIPERAALRRIRVGLARDQGLLMRTGTELVSGVTVPLVTAMDPGGQPSAAASLALLEAMHAAGVRRLMLLGSNGEGPLIPTAAFAPFVADVVAHWRSLSESGVVTVNVTAPGTLDAVGRATIAADAGADALVMSPPIYFHHRDGEIVDHYAALAGSGLPVIAYNAPRYSNPITDAVLDGLLELEHVVGIKDSSGDLAFLTQLVARGR